MSLLLVFVFSRDQGKTCNLYLKENIRHVIVIGFGIFIVSRDQRNTCNLYFKENIRHVIVIVIGIFIQQRPA